MLGHHSPPSIQGEWLAIDDQTNNILTSLCLASYLAANWLQKLETKHCVETYFIMQKLFLFLCVTRTHTHTQHTHTHTHTHTHMHVCVNVYVCISV